MALITTIVLMDGSDGREYPSSWVARGEMGLYVKPERVGPAPDRELLEEFYPWTSVLCTRQYRVPDYTPDQIDLLRTTLGHRIV